MEDEQIVALYWARQEEAITASDEKYGRLCRTLSHRILESWEDAEECASDTWLRAWNTMPPQRPGSLGAYLARITRNLSLDRWRARGRQKRGGGLELLLGELEDCLPTAPSAEAVSEGREITRAIDRWLDSLDGADRRLFLRRYWYAEPVRDLARTAGWTPNRMAQHLRRLRLRLREALEEEGITI